MVFHGTVTLNSIQYMYTKKDVYNRVKIRSNITAKTVAESKLMLKD